MNTAYMVWTAAQGGMLIAQMVLAVQCYRAMKDAQAAARACPCADHAETADDEMWNDTDNGEDDL